MRQKLITLDPTSWDLAAKKTNFSEWVRNQLRSERNKSEYLHESEEEIGYLRDNNLRMSDLLTDIINKEKEWDQKRCCWVKIEPNVDE